MAISCFFVLGVSQGLIRVTAEDQARALYGAKKLLLASELYTVTAAGGLCGGIGFVERKDISPAKGRGKRGAGIT